VNVSCLTARRQRLRLNMVRLLASSVGGRIKRLG
jgi:hypothetical protein